LIRGPGRVVWVVAGGGGAVLVDAVVDDVVDVVVEVDEAVDDEVVEVPDVVVSPGRPMSVVESFTLVVKRVVEVVDVVAK